MEMSAISAFTSKTVSLLPSYFLVPYSLTSISNTPTLPVSTGEESEQTLFSCRAKLYHFEAPEWKERGVGTFKINRTWFPSDTTTNTKACTDDADDGANGDEAARQTSGHRPSRLIMRSDGVHRVILNTPIFREMRVGAADGGPPNGKTINFTGLEAGKPSLFILKVCRTLWPGIIRGSKLGAD
jgi:hypothetical protein